MKVVINTIEGKEVILSERTEGEEELDKKTYAVVDTVGGAKLEFDPEELYRAVKAMWGEERETFVM